MWQACYPLSHLSSSALTFWELEEQMILRFLVCLFLFSLSILSNPLRLIGDYGRQT